MYWMKKIAVAFLLLLGAAHAQGRQTLQFSVSVTPVVHSLSEDLTVRITLKNVGSKAVYVYHDLDYLVYSFARTEAGKAVPRKFIEETLPPPPDRDSFTRLVPGQVLEHTRSLSLDDLGVSTAGKYQIQFWYRSPFNGATSYGLPVWSGFLKTWCSVEVRE